MTEKKNKQISAIPTACSRLGVRAETGRITFSVAVSGKEPASLILYRKGTEEIEAEIPFPEQPFAGYVYSMKVSGISPREYEYNFRIGKKVITDPYARLVVGRSPFGDMEEKGEHQVRGGFALNGFDWGEVEKAPEIPYEDVVAYQLHVRGFTKQKNSRVRHKGTFLGVQEKIPYLKELGINQIILMPSYEFDEIIKEKGIGTAPAMVNDKTGTLIQENTSNKKLNYWGYTSGCYFAPKFSYSATGKPDREFKSMVKAFHENGMEVVMQFCFPDPVDLVMVNECLLWWVQEYHVDGFQLLMNQEAANKVAANPFLGRTKLMCNYFPTEQIYPEGRNGRTRNLAECHDGFKVDIRRLLKGDEDMLAAFVHRTKYNPADSGVLNYVTNQDGFTLMDLVSYDKKHNEENGEQGHDGSEYNFSWNCGAEGPTRKKKVLDLRMQQMKNAFAMLLLSQGTPMIRAGDEFGNSQGGNNNPYCLDNEVSWVDWSKEKSYQELTDFVKRLIAFRKEHKILHLEKPLTGNDMRSMGYPDVSAHGSRAWYGGFEPVNRHVGLMYCGMYAGQEEFLYVAYNLHWEPQEMALPFLPEGMEWQKVLDTAAVVSGGAMKKMQECGELSNDNREGSEDKVQGTSPLVYDREFQLPSRSIRVLVSKKTGKTSEKKAAAKKRNKVEK